jgi:hypothetical protein
MRADARARRCATLAVALWGRTSDFLERQLLAPHPEIPSGFELADFRELEARVRIISKVLGNRSSSALSPMFVGSQYPTLWEARREVVRRAIEYLENQ